MRHPVHRLQTIEVHSPSENTIDGKRFDVEVQFWHMAPGPQYTVIAVMLRKGSGSPLWVTQLSKMLQKAVFKYNDLEPTIDFQVKTAN